MNRYNKFSGVYDKFRVEYPDEFIDYLIDKIPLKKNSVVCDLGCGTGKFAKKIINNVKHVDGVDTSENMLSIANNLGEKLTTINSSANSFLDFQKYDAIFISHSFHWMNKKKVLKNTYLNLKKNGAIAIFWNNSNSMLEPYYLKLQNLVRTYHEKPISEYRGSDTCEILKKTNLYKDITKKSFEFDIKFSINEYMGLLESKSYVSDDIPKDMQSDFFSKARTILENQGEPITERFNTDLYYAIKR
ncbi:MAG: class I SAM-dependent DNA methyltransferase [Nanobdellota archaeon]